VAKSINKASIMVLGVSYKRNIKDTRESPALDVIRLLEEKGAKIEYNDPFVPEIDWNLSTHKSKSLTADRLKKADITIILTDHTQYDYQWIVDNSKLVFDTRNATKKVSKNRSRIDLL
jgi:UDP-N-acetyl-D-glucosamine dehydrogenase